MQTISFRTCIQPAAVVQWLIRVLRVGSLRRLCKFLDLISCGKGQSNFLNFPYGISVWNYHKHFLLLLEGLESLKLTK